MKELLKKRWFQATFAVCYLLFGIWFSSLNYRVHENWDKYGYWMKMVFYPNTTVWRHGFGCDAFFLKKGTCLVGGTNADSDLTLIRTYSNLFKQTEYKKTAYTVVVMTVWPLKLTNILTILFFCLLFVLLGAGWIIVVIVQIVASVIGFLVSLGWFFLLGLFLLLL